MKEAAEKAREAMVEKVVETDDALLHRYLEEHHITPDELRKALRAATIATKVVPVLTGAALRNKGVQPLLDAVVQYLPSPLDVPPVTGTDPKTGQELVRRPTDDDPFSALAFKIASDPFVGKLAFFRVISGMGELHLEVIVDRMLREFRVAANVGRPQVAYREALTKPAQGEGRYVRQSGGKGQYGHVIVDFEPLERGTGFEYEWGIRGDRLSKDWQKAVQQGIKEAMENGVIAGYPMVDLRATVVDGSQHEVDSNEMAFKIAGSMALKAAVPKAGPVIVEPIMKVEVIVPEEFMGEVIGGLNSRRGHVKGTEDRANARVISAMVPLAQMFGYVTDLRSKTQGRGSYSMEFDHYEVLPQNLADQVINKK